MVVVVGFVWDSRNEGEGGAGDGVQLYVLIMHIPRGSTKNTMCLAKKNIFNSLGVKQKYMYQLSLDVQKTECFVFTTI